MMTLKYTLTSEDYIAFNLYHSQHSQSLRKMIAVQRILPALVFIVFGLFLASWFQMPFLFALSIYSILALIWILYYPHYFKRTLRKRVSKMLNEKDNRTLLGDYVMILGPEGFESKSNSQETKIEWSGIQSLEVTKDYIFLYNSSISAFILPSSAFHSEEERETFIKLVTNYIQ